MGRYSTAAVVVVRLPVMGVLSGQGWRVGRRAVGAGASPPPARGGLSPVGESGRCAYGPPTCICFANTCRGTSYTPSSPGCKPLLLIHFRPLVSKRGDSRTAGA